jgi:hypothetical protein
MTNTGVVFLSRISAFIDISFRSPGGLTLRLPRSERGEENTERRAVLPLPLIQIRLATPSLEKTRQPVKTIRRKRESPIHLLHKTMKK